VRSVLAFILALLGGAVALWLWVAFFAGREDYLALIRAAFLLLGLGGIGWGLISHRRDSVGVGLGLVVMGLGSFYFEGARQHTHLGSFVWQIETGLMRPLVRGITLAHVLVASLLVGNAMMAHRRLGVYHMFTGNIVLLASAVAAALVLR
jgi:hypothetical protein